MKVQLENEIMSSFLQFVDHEVCSKGEAFTNHSSFFYPTSSLYNGYYTYTCLFQQLVGDKSIGDSHGANIMDGVYVDGAFHLAGANSSGLHSINHQKVHLYFNWIQNSVPPAPVISGNFAVKTF